MSVKHTAAKADYGLFLVSLFKPLNSIVRNHRISLCCSVKV